MIEDRVLRSLSFNEDLNSMVCDNGQCATALSDYEQDVTDKNKTRVRYETKQPNQPTSSYAISLPIDHWNDKTNDGFQAMLPIRKQCSSPYSLDTRHGGCRRNDWNVGT